MIRWSIPRRSLTIIRSTWPHVWYSLSALICHLPHFCTRRRDTGQLGGDLKMFAWQAKPFCHQRLSSSATSKWTNSESRPLFIQKARGVKLAWAVLYFKNTLLWFLTAVSLVFAMTDGSVQDYKTNFTRIQKKYYNKLVPQSILSCINSVDCF